MKKERTLQYKFPEIAKEWHPTLNGDHTPDKVSYGSNEIIWWQCQKIKTHVYDSAVKSRTGKLRTGCSFCSGNKLSPERSLAVMSPEISKEWHYSKNKPLVPEKVANSSNRKVWWQCQKFKDHIWDAPVYDRTRKDGKSTNCPDCGSSRQTSKGEMRILAELRGIFKNVISRKKISKLEIDIYLPDLKIGIEYDGSYFHKNKFEFDKNKNEAFKNKNISLMRVREKPLPKIDEKDIFVSEYNLFKEDIDNLLNKIIQNFEIKSKSLLKQINDYINQKNFINDELFNIYISSFPSPLPEKSLQEIFPEIAKEWHFGKNYPLTPLDFTPGSQTVVWWQCQKINSHIYDVPIKQRTRQDGKASGCSFCGGKKITFERSLAKLSPEIAKEWHPTKNYPLTPEDVFNQSHKNVWWQCPVDTSHIYELRIDYRTRKLNKLGCRKCSENKRLA